MIRADCGTENTSSQFQFNVLKHGGVYLGGAAQTGGFAF